VPGESHVAGEDCTHDDLALAADVEETGAKRQPDRQPAHDQRSGIDQRLRDRTEDARERALGGGRGVIDRTVEQGRVAVEYRPSRRAERVQRGREEVRRSSPGIGVGHGDEHGANRHRHDEGQQREDGPVAVLDGVPHPLAEARTSVTRWCLWRNLGRRRALRGRPVLAH